MSQTHTSLWMSNEKRPFEGQLAEEIQTEVAIVGAGITGLTLALELSRVGLKTVVLEKFHVSGGTTGFSSAHLSTLWDRSFHTVLEEFDQKTATDLYQAMVLGLEYIEKESGAGVGFKRVPGYYHLSRRGEGREAFEHEKEALRKLKVPFKCTRDPVFKTIALELPRQGLCQPAEYVEDLAKKYVENGGKIYTHTAVEDFEAHTLFTSHGKVSAKYIVWATHTPLGFNPLQTLLTPKRSFISVFRLSREFPQALFWDTSTPYFYLRPFGEKHVLVGGEDVETGTTHLDDRAYARLEEYAEILGIEEVVGEWSAQFYDSSDHLPLIGEDPMHSDHFVATGFSGDGLVLGSFAGQALARQICGKQGWQAMMNTFKPLRLESFLSGEFYSHNLKVAKHLLADRFTNHGDHPEDRIRPGQGAVIDEGTDKVALYKDNVGRISKFSAICPHMKGVVKWNPDEASFDCPCHGSRFNTQGEVIEGPALHGLKRIEDKELMEPAVVPPMAQA